MFLLLGCVPADTTIADDTAAVDSALDTATHADDTGVPTDDTGEPVDTDPVDLDGDGVAADLDCDDRQPTVYPGAPELWNDRDDDCDGVIDADGAWSGDIAMSASAVYEGRPYNYALVCPLVGTRTLGVFAYVITCTPDPGDADAQRLLGEHLVVTPDDPAVTGDTWEDRAVFTSDNGWDSNGDGLVTWSDWATANVAVSMGGVSLSASGSGTIRRE